MKFPTCKDVSQLASDAMERELTFRESWGLRLHLWVCQACRRFVKHLRFLRRAANEAGEELQGSAKLGSEAKERIRKQLATGHKHE